MAPAQKPIAPAQKLPAKPVSKFYDLWNPNYDTNYYGQLGLAVGSTPLYNPTVKGKPGSAAYNAEVARAKAASVGLDDGSSLNFNSAANKGTEMPYLSTKNPVRVGAKVTFTAPVIMDYRNSEWKFQPTQQLTPANAATVKPPV